MPSPAPISVNSADPPGSALTAMRIAKEKHINYHYCVCYCITDCDSVLYLLDHYLLPCDLSVDTANVKEHRTVVIYPAKDLVLFLFYQSLNK